MSRNAALNFLIKTPVKEMQTTPMATLRSYARALNVPDANKIKGNELKKILGQIRKAAKEATNNQKIGLKNGILHFNNMPLPPGPMKQRNMKTMRAIKDLRGVYKLNPRATVHQVKAFVVAKLLPANNANRKLYMEAAGITKAGELKNLIYTPFQRFRNAAQKVRDEKEYNRKVAAANARKLLALKKAVKSDLNSMSKHDLYMLYRFGIPNNLQKASGLGTNIEENFVLKENLKKALKKAHNAY